MTPLPDLKAKLARLDELEALAEEALAFVPPAAGYSVSFTLAELHVIRKNLEAIPRLCHDLAALIELAEAAKQLQPHIPWLRSQNVTAGMQVALDSLYDAVARLEQQP